MQTINYASHSNLFQTINTNTTLLTPNRRLAATLHKLYHQYQSQQQKKSWLTPDILPITTWINRLFTELTTQTFDDHPVLLNASQEQFVWENILTHSKENDFLLQVTETAELAKSAHHLLKEWQVDFNDPLFDTAEDYKALQNWAHQFEIFSQDNKWIDQATLTNLISVNIKKKLIRPLDHIVLIGFTELSPQYKELLINCQTVGSKVTFVVINYLQSSSHRISLANEEAEMFTLARWAKSVSTNYPLSSIGCVIPSLNHSRDRIKQIFSEIFSIDNSSESVENFVNISAGKKFINYPIIHAAIQLLALSKKTVSIELLSYLLTTPFIGEADYERFKRAYFDSLLRKANITQIDLSIILKEDQSSLSLTKHCPALAKNMRLFVNIITHPSNHSLSFSKWASLFHHCLSLLGWPGEKSLNSSEYQIVENWLNFLSDYSTLDQVSGPVTLYQALQKLIKMAASYTFQPESPDTSIQILGVLEAAALPFDYLWVAEIDDLTWPPQPKPHPLIPKRLQKKLGMPHATAERELHYCKQLLSQFRQSAKEIIFSHAEKKEEIIAYPSPLIEDFPLLTTEDLSLKTYESISKRIFHSKLTESLFDEDGPSLSTQEKISGGVDLIKQQALCPFKAFAKFRLKASELEVPTLGLRPKDRGNIIHKTLEILWTHLKTQETLLSLDEQTLNNLISQAIHSAMNAFSEVCYGNTQYLKLEEKHLNRLIKDWMDLEKTRESFEVATIEASTQITLNNLTLSIRIDRIDELANGKKIIIDYKTGKNNEISSWFSHRPDEPQLPLYLLLDAKIISAIVFAQVSAGDYCFKGVSSALLEMKGVKLISEIKKAITSSWEEQIDEWKIVLNQLSDDFYSGKAQIDPKNNQVCVWCAYQSLCRINEETSFSLPSETNLLSAPHGLNRANNAE